MKMVYFSDFGKGTWTNRHAGRTHGDIIGQISFLFKEGKCAIEGTSFSTSNFFS
jgi:hypothetical protein